MHGPWSGWAARKQDPKAGPPGLAGETLSIGVRGTWSWSFPEEAEGRKPLTAHSSVQALHIYCFIVTSTSTQCNACGYLWVQEAGQAVKTRWPVGVEITLSASRGYWEGKGDDTGKALSSLTHLPHSAH